MRDIVAGLHTFTGDLTYTGHNDLLDWVSRPRRVARIHENRGFTAR
jgi:hypothetical protein